jgi:FKBP-type peptidyl-prolyl cis-trans isomerase SlyD
MQDGDFVEIDYTGRIKDTGEIFDLTDENLAKSEDIFNEKFKYGPVKLVIGEGFVLKGLEEALREMKVGEEKTVALTPEKAFGQRKADLIKIVPEAELRKQKVNPIPGMILDMGEYKARIQSVNSGRVRLDFNNPLAGRDIEYQVKINKKVEDKEEKAKAIIEFFCRDAATLKLTEKVAEVEEKAQLPESLKQKVAELIKKYVGVERVEFKRVF